MTALTFQPLFFSGNAHLRVEMKVVSFENPYKEVCWMYDIGGDFKADSHKIGQTGMSLCLFLLSLFYG